MEDGSMANNSHKKEYKEDKFARHFYCDHARLNRLREDKKQGKRKHRRNNKKIEKNFEKTLDK
jgi:hypothetical protein